MNIAKDPTAYAQELIDLGFTYADYKAQYGHYSNYSELVRQAMLELGDTTAATLADLVAEAKAAEADLKASKAMDKEATETTTKAYLQHNVTGNWWSNVTPIDCPKQYADALVSKLNEAEEARGSKARYRVSMDGREYNPLAVKKVYSAELVFQNQDGEFYTIDLYADTKEELMLDVETYDYNSAYFNFDTGNYYD